MRRLLLLIYLLGIALQADAAMSDARAQSEAKKRFGPKGNIFQKRDPTGSFWIKQVGVDSPNCISPGAVLGEGNYTWDAAFAAVPATAIKGPYSGIITLKAQGWDDRGVTGWQWILDGNSLGPEIIGPGTPTLDVVTIWDTAMVPNGMHVLCASDHDADGNTSRGFAIVIRIDQTQPSIGTELRMIQGVGGRPVVGQTLP